MEDQVGLADAERALGEIDRRREQVIRRAVVPDWYWWATGAQIIVLTAAVENLHGLLLWISVAQFVLGMLGTTTRVVVRLLRGAKPRIDLCYDARSIVAILVGSAAFQAIIVGVSLAVGFSLKAAKVAHPATITAAVAAVMVGIGGPMLMRYLTRVMLASRSGRYR